MSLSNSLFSEEVENDVILFAQLQTRKRVLVFPPVNNYRRFLIHQIVQDHFNDLHTFSIGQDTARRTVVCFKSDVLRDPKLNVEPSFWSKGPSDNNGSRMGLEDRRSPSTSPENTKSRQVKSTPAVEIYRPPALRSQLSSVTSPTVGGEQSPASKMNRQRRPDRAVYVPKHRRSGDLEGSPQHQEDTPPPPPPSSSSKAERKNRLSSEILCENLKIQLENNETIEIPVKLDDDSSIKSANHQTSLPLDENGKEAEEKTKNKDDTELNGDNDDGEDVNDSCDSMPNDDCNDSVNGTQPEILKTDKIIKQSDVPSVLIISDCNSPEKNVEIKISDDDELAITPRPSEKKPKKISRAKSKPASPPSPQVKLNRDECDWDSLFDDNGDCLDPTLIEELTAAVGEVTIEQPKNNYKPFTRPIEVSTDEFAHVVEIYNFPSEYKTSDLATVFSPFRNGGFELKWVDDTHCLGVFSSPLVAAEVLASDHPFVKTRPLSEATTLSKTKARRSGETLQPYRKRPETNVALARRLVTGALGVKLATARQEREQEKIVLREAKERKRLANQQRDDAWEGIITPK